MLFGGEEHVKDAAGSGDQLETGGVMVEAGDLAG
jgi:hypothetical protein